MRKLPLIAAFFLSLSLAFGQIGSNSITVTASSNNGSSQPDQAVFSVQVTTGLDSSLDDVIAVLQGSGISAANFQGLNSFLNYIGPAQPTQTLSWSFQLTTPLAKVKDTITTLSSLQAKIAAQNTGLALSFSIQGTQSSGQPAACSLPALLTNARTQAQNLADGAGLSVGNILAMSSPTPSACTLTVKFALVRN